jgi:hypothetical protein
LFQGILISTAATETSKALIFIERHAEACKLVLGLRIHLADLATGWGRVKIHQGGVFVFEDIYDDVQRVELVDDSAEGGGNGKRGDRCHGEREDGLGQVHCRCKARVLPRCAMGGVWCDSEWGMTGLIYVSERETTTSWRRIKMSDHHQPEIRKMLKSHFIEQDPKAMSTRDIPDHGGMTKCGRRFHRQYFSKTCQRVEKSLKKEMKTALCSSVMQKPSELDHIARQR